MNEQDRTKDGKKCINVSPHELEVEPTHRHDFKEEMEKRLDHIEKEFTQTFEFIERFPKSVTFFGSARFKHNNVHYKQAERLAARLCKEGFTVITGGGPGIMEAANLGAREACGESIGLNIELPFEQVINPYVTESKSYHYFFTRKVGLAFSAEAYLYFPGGFGTLDEFFEIITLIQTKKIPQIPVICVGVDFWQPLDAFIRKTLLEEHTSISEDDLDLYVITDDEELVVDIVKAAPMHIE